MRIPNSSRSESPSRPQTRDPGETQTAREYEISCTPRPQPSGYHRCVITIAG